MGIFKKPKVKETTLKIKISVYLEKDEDNYLVYCPELKGLIADGNSEDIALKNFADAAQAYIMSIIKHGDPLPVCTTIKEKDLPAHPVIRDVEVPLDITLNQGKNSFYKSA